MKNEKLETFETSDLFKKYNAGLQYPATVSFSDIRESFKPRMIPNPSPEYREALNVEYRAAIKHAEKELKKENAARVESNRALFAANPAECIVYLETRWPSSSGFRISEHLQDYGIAEATAKRTGKGVLRHKGTLAEGTISPYSITVRLLGKTFVYEVAARNSKRDRRDTENYGVSLALRELGLKA